MDVTPKDRAPTRCGRRPVWQDLAWRRYGSLGSIALWRVGHRRALKPVSCPFELPFVSPAAPQKFDADAFRSALGQFATGVTVITTLGKNGAPMGLTANSFSSVSLDPPLVLWSLGVNASSQALFRASTHYAVNVLASEQIDLSRRFGSRAMPPARRFEGIDWRKGTHGVPILGQSCAWFLCSNRSRYLEGDHVIFVGEVEELGFSAHEPLIFQNGRYHMTQPHPGSTEKVA
jgi:flavin reductase (DIM6/NTAB) family NADH-FMN oxidoreductase RutF